MTVLVLAVIAQGATVIAWRRRVPVGRHRGVVRRAAGLCGAGMLLAVWLADTGFAAQAATSMEAGKYQPINDYALAVIGWTALALVSFGIVGMVSALLVRDREASARTLELAPVIMAAARNGEPDDRAPAGGRTPDPLTILAWHRRRANRYITAGVIATVAIVTLAAWAAATGHWETRMTFMVPAWLGITVVGVRRMMVARRHVNEVEAQIRAHRPQPSVSKARRAVHPDPAGGDDPHAAR